MKKNKKLITVASGIIMIGALALPAYAAETKIDLSTLTISQLEALVQTLTEQIKNLTAQVNSQTELIAKLRLNSEHRRGEQNDEIKLLQRILATDPILYPEGYITGYFGEYTSQAISRFQKRYGLTATGTLTLETKELINKILDSEGDKAIREIPPGLLSAPGLAGRVIVQTENNGGQIVYKIEVKNDEDGDEDSNEDEVNDEDGDEELDIDVRIDDDDAKVKVEQNGTETIFTLDETDEEEIIDKLIVRLGVDRDEIEDAIDFDHVDNNSTSWDSDDSDDSEDDN
jgi:peptidoglycan hydrolase-like protein with peptidoglycan-binding domain